MTIIARYRLRHVGFFLLCILYVGLGLLFVPHAARANATLVVNSVGDADDANTGDGICETATPGECTLRAAISQANAANGEDLINFSIPGSGVHKITLQSELPELLYGKVIINGYSQTEAFANTVAAPGAMNSVIKIELDGSGLGQNKNGIVLDTAGASEVRGLAIFGFDSTDGQHGNLIINQNDAIVAGNYIGLDATGQARGNGNNNGGVTILENRTNNTIGGILPADRNIITYDSNNDDGRSALTIGGSSNLVYGNFIGLGRDGTTEFAGSYGVSLNGSSNRVGGASNDKRNVISGFSLTQLFALSSDNLVQGNYIGTDSAGSVISGITNGAGIVITGTAAGNMIGGSLSGAGNKVAGVNGIGIGVQMLKLDNPLIPQKNAILGNSIRQIGIIDYPGFGESNQGIDIYKNFINNSGSVITKQGPNANNTTDPDGAPNNFMNYPVIKSATQNGAVVTISYDLDVSGSPNNQYRVEFFANDTATIFNYGPGETYLGAVTVPSGNNKISTINLQPGQVFNYKALTATATQLDNTITSGFGSTSEFSLNRTIGTNLDTDGDGASNITEDAAPNNGDADGDGIQDSLQSTVTSFMTDGVGGQPGTYISFNTSGCTDNGTVASIDPKTFAKQDAGYAYPFGYVNFSLKCSRGSTATITKYIYSDLDPKDFTLRKYRGDTQAYMEIEDADITRQVIAGKNAVKVVYGIADGGALDDDGTANGVIVDPVGLATKVGSKSASLGGLPSVGIATIYVLIPLLLAFLTTLAYVYRDYRKHKKPLVDENPDIEYTFLHHIQVVTLPILKYRLSIIVQPRGSA